MSAAFASSANGTRPSPVDWSAVLDQHRRWLRTVVSSRVGEPQAVEEVLQEVALAVLAGRALPTDPEKVAPWLYRVAVLQSLLYRRKEGRRRKLLGRFADQQGSSSAADPLQWMLADERRAQVRAALQKLPRRDAEILLLKYTEDWSYRELADHLGVSVSAVEARLHRARQRLRELLEQPQPVEKTT